MQSIRRQVVGPKTNIYPRQSNAVSVWWYPDSDKVICDLVFTALFVTPAPGAILWNFHDDVINWKPFPPFWCFVRGIHRSPVNFPHKGLWRGALMSSLICTRINGCYRIGRTSSQNWGREWKCITSQQLCTSHAFCCIWLSISIAHWHLSNWKNHRKITKRKSATHYNANDMKQCTKHFKQEYRYTSVCTI